MTLVAEAAIYTLKREALAVVVVAAATVALISTTLMVEALLVELHHTRATPEEAVEAAWVLRVEAETWVECIAWVVMTTTQAVDEEEEVVEEAAEDTQEAAEATIVQVDPVARVSRITRQ